MEDNIEETISTGGSGLYLAIGWIAAIMSLAAYPFVFGVVGIIMGVLASKNQSKGGLPLIFGSIILMGIGLMFGHIIMDYIREYTTKAL
ncbi:MAG TPA: hypothetical protein GXX37_02345 [Clostridiaceae bacterium]|nr:hypothetical protein [Clostridiaceae bacterium]